MKSVPDPFQRALLAADQPWSPAARRWLVGKSTDPWQAPHYRRVIWGLLALIITGALGLLWREPAARRVALLGVASAVGYNVAVWAIPYAYLPERYSIYSVALLGTLAVSTCAAGLVPASLLSDKWRRLRAALIAAQVALVLWLFAGRISQDTGVNIDLNGEPLLAAIAALPIDSLIAAWPLRLTNSIPYATRRRVLVTFETHQAFHRNFILEMRGRMRALIDAYFATSLEPIERLRDRYGVTHLLIERSHFKRRPPSYFKPFDEWINDARSAAQGKRYELPEQISAASIYHSPQYELLDLSRLKPRPTP